jgi:hypothetical protein
MEEIWKPIKNFEDYYEVSDLGRFRSKDRIIFRSDGKTENRPGRILKNNYYSNGYTQLFLYKENKKHTFIGHRVVAKHFLDDYSENLVINHKNMIRDDNRVSNLEVCSQKENVNKAFEIKKWNTNTTPGEKCLFSKLKEKDVVNIRFLYKKGKCINTIYEIYKNIVSRQTIYKVVNRKTWNHI